MARILCCACFIFSYASVGSPSIFCFSLASGSAIMSLVLLLDQPATRGEFCISVKVYGEMTVAEFKAKICKRVQARQEDIILTVSMEQ